MNDPAADPAQLARLPIAELRERAQAPSRAGNDIGGVLFGDWVSPFLTREFLRFGWSPTVGTIGMLVAGISGAVLVPFGGVWSVLGACCFVLFYILDCVDGEVARLRGIDRYYWTFPDFFIGAGVMAAFYVAIGIHAMLLTGVPWLLLAGACLAIVLLIKKLLDVCHLFLVLAHVAGARSDQRRRYMAELGVEANGGEHRSAVVPDQTAGADRPLRRGDVISAYGRGWVGPLRGIVTNFHLGMLAFLAVAIVDLFAGPWRLFGVPFDLKSTFLVLFLPVYLGHVADHLVTLWRGRFLVRSAATLRLLMKQGWSPEGPQA